MRRIVFTVLLFAVSLMAFAQQKNVVVPKLKGPEAIPLHCRQYHNGTFKILYLDKKIIIKRFGNTQTEYVSDQKKPIVYKVKWLSDCTYTLTPTKETIRLHPDIKKGTVLTVDMVQQNTKSFTQMVSANYTQAKVNLEVYPIK